MINGFAILIIFFTLLMIYITYVHFKRRDLQITEFIFFSIVWLSMVILSLFPSLINSLLKALNILRLLDLATILGFLFLITISFGNYLEIKKLRKKIEKIVREKALKETE